MSGLLLLVATRNCWISHKNEYVRLFGPSLTASLEPLSHRRNVTSLSLFYRYYLSRCLSELTQLVRLHYSRGRCTCYSDKLYDFSVTIPCYSHVYVNSFFPSRVSFWNCLPIKCFHLTFDLNGFNSKVNGHI